jgi:hypothetical protein
MDATPNQQTLELLRSRIGLAPNDTAKDVEILASYVMTISLLEKYLDRFLTPGNYIEEFTHVAGRTVSLKGYPVLDIQAVVNSFGYNVEAYHVDKQNGLIHFDGTLISHQLSVQYDCEPPNDGALVLAFMNVFDMVYGNFTKVGVNASVGGGAIKAIRSNGASIEYDTSGGSSGSTGIDSDTGLPAACVGLLEPFRRRWA